MTDAASSVPLTRRDRRREQTYRRLLTAAESLFKVRGFDATTVEEIAAAADVAKGTFFNYFSSKEMLLGELLYMRTERLLLDIPAAGQPAAERIWQLLIRIRQELAPYVHLFPRMFAYVLAHPHLHGPSDDYARDHVTLADALAQLMRQGQREGVFRSACDAEIAGSLMATYFFRLSLVECVQENADFCWEDQMQAALALLYQGLAAG